MRIDRVGVAVGDVGAEDHLAGEVGVGVVDAGVDDRDHDGRVAGPARPRLCGADPPERPLERQERVVVDARELQSPFRSIERTSGPARRAATCAGVSMSSASSGIASTTHPPAAAAISVASPRVAPGASKTSKTPQPGPGRAARAERARRARRAGAARASVTEGSAATMACVPDFRVSADYRPTGDQPQAIDALAAGVTAAASATRRCSGSPAPARRSRWRRSSSRCSGRRS